MSLAAWGEDTAISFSLKEKRGARAEAEVIEEVSYYRAKKTVL